MIGRCGVDAVPLDDSAWAVWESAMEEAAERCAEYSRLLLGIGEAVKRCVGRDEEVEQRIEADVASRTGDET